MNISPLISLDRIIDLIKEIWHDMKPIIFINEYEKGVILRAGKLNRVIEKGTHFRIPFIDDYLTVMIKVETLPTHSVHITTLDDRTITAVPIVEYVVIDPVKYLIETNEAKSNIHDIVRATVSDYLTDCTWDECKLKRTINAITRKVAEQCVPMGAQVSRVMLSDMCICRVIITSI